MKTTPSKNQQTSRFILKPEALYGICTLSIVPCRKEPSGKSEMLSQLLFGEHFEILKEEDEWYFIRNAYDGYESWINKKQAQIINRAVFKKLISASHPCSADLVCDIISAPDKVAFPIVIGSTLPFLTNKKIFIGEKEYSFKGKTTQNTGIGKERIIQTASLFLNSPYLWGGRSPFGIDCSGFTQIVYRLNGINLRRDSRQQAEQGKAVAFEKAMPGDLAFFDNEEGRIVHVGIILKNKQVIHASGKVRVDTIDKKGIFNAELKQYSHSLKIIKRIT